MFLVVNLEDNRVHSVHKTRKKALARAKVMNQPGLLARVAVYDNRPQPSARGAQTIVRRRQHLVRQYPVATTYRGSGVIAV